jgi:hypothetical protein
VTPLTRNYINYIDLSFFVHATEDQNKVLEACQKVIPSEYIDQITFNKSNLKGEYGNPITFFKTKIKKAEVAEAFLKRVLSNLTSLDRETLLREMDLRLKKGSLYIRLDKQAALKGEFKLCRADPIHIRIRFRTSKIEEIREICRKIGALP